MKKLIIIALALAFGAMPVWGEEAKKTFSFRGVEFGMGIDEVEAIETGEMQGEINDGVMSYEIKEEIYDFKSFALDYKFEFNKLNAISLFIFVPPTMKDYKTQYAEIKADLWAEYGGDDKDLVNDDIWFSCLSNVLFNQSFKVDAVFANYYSLEPDEDEYSYAIIIDFTLQPPNEKAQ